MVKRKLRVYLPITFLLVALGLPARLIHRDDLPHWYYNYAGDFLWAMLIYFSWCLVFGLRIKAAIVLAIASTYGIEISQLFHPPWLEQLRSFKIFALILGYGFLWSDIIAYSLGISVGALIDRSFIVEHSLDQS